MAGKGGFIPGSGRKPVSYERGFKLSLAQAFTPEKRLLCFERLVRDAMSNVFHERHESRKLLFAYAYGKPTEHVEVQQVAGRDDQVVSARTSFMLAALSQLQAQHPTASPDELTRQAEAQFDAWLSSLTLDHDATASAPS